MKRWLFAVMAIIVNYPAMAVDGYKDLKFGMSKQQVVKMKPCAMFKGNSAPAGAESLECNDFKFGGARVDAGFFFINGKFERIGMLLKSGKVAAVLKSLKDKYGPPSSASTKEQLAAVATTPGSTAYIAFDEDTIYLYLMVDEQMNEQTLLVYTSPDYDEKITIQQSASIDSDI